MNSMSQINDMYRMVKMVNKEVVRMDRLEPQAIAESGQNVWQAATSNVIKLYIKRRPWLVATESYHTVRDCIISGYLSEDYVDDSFGSRTDTLYIEKAGRKLIEKTWFIFPTGLWKAWYEDNGKIFLALMSALVLLLGGIVTLLTKIALFPLG